MPSKGQCIVTIAAGLMLQTSAFGQSSIACDGPLFVDAIDDANWTNIDVAPIAGTAGIRDALIAARDAHPDSPVRIRLAPGVYADTLGAEIYAQHMLRIAASPVYLQATNPSPNATVLGQGINLVGVSYVAIEGVTIGPSQVGAWNGSMHTTPLPLAAQAGIHIAGTALNGQTSAVRNGAIDLSIYGRFVPSHHLIVRSVTIQNLFAAADFDGETAAGYDEDGIKFNQAEDVWVLDSSVNQTSRHGIDNVGVHRGAFCRNVVAHNGGGLGIEAKGGSTDILYEGNVFYRVRRVELGGEHTDATYYFSADGRWDYEALNTVARNNIIIDAREAALEFSGCASCTAIANTIYFTAGYQPPLDGTEVAGGDGIRIHDSQTGSAAEGAGSDCQTWSDSAQDYVAVNPCWGVGANPPAPVDKMQATTNVTVASNVFASSAGHFGVSYDGSTNACPLNAMSAPSLLFDANYWWNDTASLPAGNCSALPDGGKSVWSTTTPIASPGFPAGELDSSTPATLRRSAPLALTPSATSPLVGKGISTAVAPSLDQQLFARPQPPGIGALEAPTSGNPTSGLWAVDAEMNGQPGRGFTIESQNGVTVVTVFGYDPAGNSAFYQTAAPISGNQLSSTLSTFSGGAAFGQPHKDAARTGSAGIVGITFSDAEHGTVTFPGESAKTISKFNWHVPATADAFAPARGLWSIASETDGQPGRGMSVETQGQTLVVTIYGYAADGRGAFYQAAGALSGQSLDAPIEEYQGGTTFGGARQSAAPADSPGQIHLHFFDVTHGVVTFPGESPKNIAAFRW